MIETVYTARGFVFATFTDLFGAKCSIQKSSVATEDCIWLGVHNPDASVMSADAPGDSMTVKLELYDGSTDTTGWKRLALPPAVLVGGRMHLSRDMVAELLPVLQHFVATGELPTEGGRLLGLQGGKTQFAVKTSRYVDDSQPFNSEAEARKAIREAEEADRAYDIPNPPRRCVVARSVTPWRKVQKKKKGK